MKNVLLMSTLAILLAGCYGYTTVRTIKPEGRECSVHVSKGGNALVGYTEGGFSNLERGEKDCREWLRK